MISLIVPVYNIKSYLSRCIDSILAQTYRDFELILVDDGATDGSSEVCDYYGKQDKRIVVIHKQNGGLVSARKAGIASARGEYAGFVDGDDWIEPQMYQHLTETAMKCQADIVLGGSIEEAGGQTIQKTNRLNPGMYEGQRLWKELYPSMLCAGEFFCMGVQPYLWNKLVRRGLAYSCIMSVDDRIRVGEDVAAVMPMLLKADRVVITDYCEYHYCIRDTSMMWEHGNEEKEQTGLGLLHCHLQSVLSCSGICNFESQLNHYSVGNMLTRTYGRLADRDEEGVLWPFAYRINSRKCILYSAGHFGRAVYGYLQECYPNMVGLWVDREYQRYQAMGLPVHSVDDISAETEADILVAILDLSLADLIRNNLLQSGVRQDQIYCIRITEDDVREIIGSI